MDGVAGWRVADCYLNWIMGQAFFCGSVAEKYGFPRAVRHKYKPAFPRCGGLRLTVCADSAMEIRDIAMA
jgi:hypothetical protein